LVVPGGAKSRRLTTEVVSSQWDAYSRLARDTGLEERVVQNVLEEKNMRFWLMHLIVFPPKTLEQ
jgi:hypothetical protein